MAEKMETVRSSLPSILDGFATHPHGRVVHFGRHRRDEAVVVSAAEYGRLRAAARQVEELERLGAMQLAGDRLADGHFTDGTVEELFAAADAAG